MHDLQPVLPGARHAVAAQARAGRELRDLRRAEMEEAQHQRGPRERMLARAGRHPVHYDAEVADEVAERARAGEWEPLPLGGETLRIDTSSPQDVAALAERIATMTA